MRDSRLDEFKGQATVAILGADSEPFNLREIGKEAHADAACGVAVHGPEEVGCAKVIAVKLFRIEAILFGEIGSRTNCEYLRDILERSGNLHIWTGSRCFDRLLFWEHDKQPRLAIRIELLRIEKTHRRVETHGMRIDGPGKDRTASRRNLVECARHHADRSGQRARKIDQPQIDGLGRLACSRDVGDLGCMTLKLTGYDRRMALRVEREVGEKAERGGDAGLADNPKRFGIVRPHLRNEFVIGKYKALPGLPDQIGQLGVLCNFDDEIFALRPVQALAHLFGEPDRPKSLAFQQVRIMFHCCPRALCLKPVPMTLDPIILRSKRRRGAIQKAEHGVQAHEHHLIAKSFLDEVHWDDLDLFKAVAVAGSLRKAAIRLGISVNTVRARIDRLEQTLGVQLFERSREGVRISAEGTRILDVALEMQSLSSQIRAGDTTRALARPGQISISCSEGVGEFWLTPRLAALQERLPGTVISLNNDFDQHRIHTARHDIALSFARTSDPDMIVSRIATLHFALYASARYLARFGEPASLDEASDHRLVVQEAAGLNPQSLTLFIGEFEASRLSIVKVNTSYSLYWAVANGVGIGALPTYVRAISRNVRPLDLPVQLRFDLWMSYHRSSRANPVLRSTVEWLREAFDPIRYPWFSDKFIHPNEFERQLEDAAVHSLYPLGEQPQN